MPNGAAKHEAYASLKESFCKERLVDYRNEPYPSKDSEIFHYHRMMEAAQENPAPIQSKQNAPIGEDDFPNVEGYEDLREVLKLAYLQASQGKGKERHANGKPFAEQPMLTIQALYGTGFALGQAAKKAEESQRMPLDKAERELLGSIIFLAGAILHRRKMGE